MGGCFEKWDGVGRNGMLSDCMGSYETAAHYGLLLAFNCVQCKTQPEKIMTNEEIRNRIVQTKNWEEVYIIIDYLIKRNDLLEKHSNRLQEMLNENFEETKRFLAKLRD